MVYNIYRRYDYTNFKSYNLLDMYKGLAISLITTQQMFLSLLPELGLSGIRALVSTKIVPALAILGMA